MSNMYGKVGMSETKTRKKTTIMRINLYCTLDLEQMNLSRATNFSRQFPTICALQINRSIFLCGIKSR